MTKYPYPAEETQVAVVAAVGDVLALELAFFAVVAVAVQ